MINKKIMIFFLAGAAACFAYSIWSTSFGKRESVEYILKNPAGEAVKDVDLEAVVEGGGSVKMELEVPSVRFTEEEAERYFTDASEQIDKLLLGEGNRPDRIVHDISLPDSLPGNPVSIEWSSSAPGVLSSSGKIGQAPADGGRATLTAAMSLDGYGSVYRYDLTVFPKETDISSLLKNEAEKINGEGGESERYYLPSELNGKEVVWYESPGTKAGTVALLFLLAALLLAVRERKRDENEEKKRNDALRGAYPELISRILLLSCAGLGTRNTMYRIASSGRRSAGRGRAGKMNAAYAEVEKLCADMDNGVGETEAYERFGERCSQAGYRTLSVLLSRSAARGGAGMLPALEQEAEASFEEAKRRAKAAGDLAAVKLLLPMAMMLVVVMIIVLVPSFLSFIG